MIDPNNIFWHLFHSKCSSHQHHDANLLTQDSITKCSKNPLAGFEPKICYDLNVVVYVHSLHTFSCDEVGLACDPSDQAGSFLLPWCCTRSYVHIVAVVDDLADRWRKLWNLVTVLSVSHDKFLPRWEISYPGKAVKKCAKHPARCAIEK
jgi:hypothetical protein